MVSHEVNQPIDGDRIRPLEALTRGAYSRRMIDSELSTFLRTIGHAGSSQYATSTGVRTPEQSPLGYSDGDAGIPV